jgi:hypothetical protein
MKPNESKYLDVLKIVEFLAEGGSETLYRLLPYGEARRGTGGAGVAPRRDARPGVNFVWRIYGNSIGENDAGEEVWEDFNAEYEDIGEYLIDREEMLAGLYPRYIDPNFREQIFEAFLLSLRQTTSRFEHVAFRREPTLRQLARVAEAAEAYRTTGHASWCTRRSR